MGGIERVEEEKMGRNGWKWNAEWEWECKAKAMGGVSDQSSPAEKILLPGKVTPHFC